MKKLDLKNVPSLKPNPLFKELPESLKDPKNFKKIEKKLVAVLKTDHAHKTIKEFTTCAWCQDLVQKRQALMKEIGFKDYGQYIMWKKVMTIISKKQSFQLR